jgi:hypothetical protein
MPIILPSPMAEQRVAAPYVKVYFRAEAGVLTVEVGAMDR